MPKASQHAVCLTKRIKASLFPKDIPSTKRQKTDHPSRVEPQLLDALCDLLGKLTLEGNDQSA